MAGQVYEGERRYDLVVRLDSLSRAAWRDLRNLYVDTPGGQKVPLEEVATVALPQRARPRFRATTPAAASTSA